VRYQDKVVIVTGGTKGIGEGCVRVFVEAGAKVVFCARNEAAGQKLARGVTAGGPGEAVFIPCDVSRPEQVERLVDAAVERYGRLDCLSTTRVGTRRTSRSTRSRPPSSASCSS